MCDVDGQLSTWQPTTAADKPAAPADNGVVIRGTIHSITLPRAEPDLPQGAGRETTQAFSALTRYTTEYIMV